jgi:uncharacterized membrane-anchored protein
MIRMLERPIAGIALAGVLLTGILGYMVMDRVRLLTNGREIVLPVRPVDPRDLFKGDFAILGFDISRLDTSLLPKTGPAERTRQRVGAAKTIYVTLEQQPDESWKPIAVTDALLPVATANQVVLKGRTRSWRQQNVIYGIERYFVPEGTGRRIEDLARSSKLSAIVAVDRSGNAAIKGLVTNGRRIYEEPLF